MLTLVPVVALFYFVVHELERLRQRATGSAWRTSSGWSATSSFRIALGNTLYYAALHIPLTIVVVAGPGAAAQPASCAASAFFRTAAFFPYITSIVAIAVVWNMLFSPEYGPINQFLAGSSASANPPGWTSPTDWAMPAVIIVGTWRDMGYYMLLFLAGLQTVPARAARGRPGRRRQRLAAVLATSRCPCLRPTMFFVTVMLTIRVFKVFDLILVMTDGGPGQSTLVLSQFIYQKGFEESQFGYASAVAVVLFVICIIVTVVQFLVNKRKERVMRRPGHGSAAPRRCLAPASLARTR